MIFQRNIVLKRSLVTAGLAITVVFLACLSLWACAPGHGNKTLTLENSSLGLSFDRSSGKLIAMENKLAGETYEVSDDLFRFDAIGLSVGPADARLLSLDIQPGELKARYQAGDLTIGVSYTLDNDNHFAEKHMTLTSSRDMGLKKVVPGQMLFSAADLRIIAYRHPKLDLNHGAEPACTFFGRTAKGGFFTGVEMPFDLSALAGQQVTFQYDPNLKIAAGDTLACEPVYLGVYRRNQPEEEKPDLPLLSESEAMVAMTSVLMPPQSRRLGPVMCGWWSETFRGPYRTLADVEHDKRSIDFALSCGIDIVSDGRTWAGETDQVNALGEGDKLRLGELPLNLAAYAREKGVRWIFWPSMGTSDPWTERGRPFRADKPEWRIVPRSPTWIPDPKSFDGLWRKVRSEAEEPATCFADRTSYDWLVARILEAMEAGQYQAWCMDGDFFGEPGFGGGPGYNGGPGPDGKAEPWVHPARCESKLHNHLSPDINYICQSNLTHLAGMIRERYPDAYLFFCRPPMDLGVWALKHADACFTINEWASLEGIPGMGPQPKNVLLGDKIRHWSRVRVQYHFFPNYLDSPLLFDAPKSMSQRDWTSEKIDYIMLSALSSSPNQIYYLPSQAGIPEGDKAVIRNWLEWGRRNIDYLMIRKDLPTWPAPGKVDGSAHIIGDRGFVFLFNPNPSAIDGTFYLDPSIGLKKGNCYRITSIHPSGEIRKDLLRGQKIIWSIPGQTAVVLEITPQKDKCKS